MGNEWLAVEEAVSILGLIERSLLPGVTHGICDNCYSEMAATLAAGEGKAP